eukprot:613452-Alexandrium_andersonii.AAC.1
MSASLVGSEMCIRDRAPSQPRTLQDPPPIEKRLQRRGAPGAPGALLGEAVSYTHLTLPTICSV